MTEVIYLKVSEKTETAKKAGRRVSVSGMLKFLGVSRSGYHAWLHRVPSLVFINDNMRFIIASSLSSNVRTNIFPYNHFQSDNKILLKKLIEIFLLIVLCFHIEITLHHNIFIYDFRICSSVQRFSCIMVCLIIC